MSKIKSSKYKIGRRLGESLWGGAKDAFQKKSYAPGQHGKSFSRAPSNYGIQLAAKQKLRAYYNIVERQFRNIVHKAMNSKGDSGENFVGMLESRLDTIVFRSGLAPTIFATGQLISHKHVTVNNKIVNFRSMMLKPGDVVTLTDKCKKSKTIGGNIATSTRIVPDYIEVDKEAMAVKFIRKPQISEVPYECTVNYGQVIEYYS